MSIPQPAASSTALVGIRVLELSQGVACAYAGRLLQLLGAEVWHPGTPLELDASRAAENAVVAWFREGKHELGATASPRRSLADYDVILIDLDATDDVLLARIAEATSITSKGERRAVVVRVGSCVEDAEPVPGTSLTAGAWAAMSWSMGAAGEVPLSLPYDLTSFEAGAHAAASALVVLLGEPPADDLRDVEVSTRDIIAYYTGMITANFIPYERPWCRDGARPPLSGGVYPASIFRCRDGFVTFMCRSQREWDALLAGMGSPEWSRDPRFRDPRVVARLYADEVDRHLVPWVGSLSQQELMDFGQQHGLPIAPVKTFEEVLAEPHHLERRFFTPAAGGSGVRVAGAPWRFSTPVSEEGTIGEAPSSPWRVAAGSGPDQLLRGLRVLDLSWVWSGPMTTAMLADLGAEVIKVEHAGHMDAGRMRGRARRNGVEVPGPEHEVTPYFNQMNHGKRSLTLDLKTERARALVLELVRECDVVVENMRPGALDRIGLGYDELSAANPGVVMLSMSMAGQTGPLRGMKGYAGIMAAMSGLDSVIGYDEAHVLGSLTPALGDPNGASHAMVALLGALVRRRRTGAGCWIDLSQIEALVSVTPAPLIEAQLSGGARVPANTHARWAPHGHFRCRGEDRWIALAVRSDAEWEKVLALAAESGVDLDRPEWRREEGRREGRADLERAIASWTGALEREAVVPPLLAAGVPAADVADYHDLLSAAWLQGRELTASVDHPYLGETNVWMVPWKFGGRTAGVAQPAPLLGAHTDDILRDLIGLDPARIEALRADDILT